MSATQAFVRSWTVGQYTATLSTPKPACSRGSLSAIVEWSPHEPERLSLNELAEYRRGRDAALRELAAETGLRVAVIEL